jgi:hypothetical protein
MSLVGRKEINILRLGVLNSFAGGSCRFGQVN